MFVVLGYRNDCGDAEAFLVEDSHGRDSWETFAEARSVMKVSYMIMSDEYSPDKTRDGKDVRERKLRGTTAEFSVPIWDGERKRESRLKCKWKVVEI